MAAIDKHGRPCPGCAHGILRAKNKLDLSIDSIQCSYCYHEEERWVNIYPKPELTWLQKAEKFVKGNWRKITFFSLVAFLITWLTAGAINQHIYESPERAILQELADRYDVPRPGLSVRTFEEFHWRGDRRLRTVGYYSPVGDTIYILPCSRDDHDEWVELVHHEFVHYYLDETNYRGDSHGPAFRRVMEDLGYDRNDISFNSNACRPDHPT